MTRELGGEQRDERQAFPERMASGMDATEKGWNLLLSFPREEPLTMRQEQLQWTC